MQYWLPNRVYDVLKWVAVILLPVMSWAIGELAPDYGIDPYKYVHAIDVLGTIIGMLIGASHLSALGKPDPDATNDLGRHMRG